MTFFRRSKGKYGAKKCELAGIRFDSQLERAVYEMLLLRQQAGEIEALTAQVTVYLTDARIQYRADFRFLDKVTGELRWAEAKGFETPEWRIKRRLWQHYGPGPLEVYKGSARNFKLFETIVPKGGNHE